MTIKEFIHPNLMTLQELATILTSVSQTLKIKFRLPMGTWVSEFNDLQKKIKMSLYYENDKKLYL